MNISEPPGSTAHFNTFEIDCRIASQRATDTGHRFLAGASVFEPPGSTVRLFGKYHHQQSGTNTMSHDDSNSHPYLAAFLESFHNLHDAEFGQLSEALKQRAEFFDEHAPELATYLQIELHDEMERQQELKAGEPRDPEFERWTNDAIGGALVAGLALMDISVTGKLYEFANHLMHTVVCEAAMRLKQDQRLREITEQWQQ